MTCTFESSCLDINKYTDKLNACMKKYLDHKDIEKCMGLSGECISCMGGLKADKNIQSKCCATDPQKFIDNFFKKNMVWFISVVVIGGLLILGLIILLLWVLLSKR